MTPVLSLLGGTPAPPATLRPPHHDTAQGGFFAQLLPQDPAAEDAPPQVDPDPHADSLDAQLAEAESALTNDNPSEEDPAALIEPLLSELAIGLSQDPQALDRLRALLDALPDSGAVEHSADARPPHSREAVAQALATLRAFVIAPGTDGADAAAPQPSDDALAAVLRGADNADRATAELDEIATRLPQKTATALSELASRILAASEDVAGKNAPVTAGALMQGVLGASRLLAGEAGPLARETSDPRGRQGQPVLDSRDILAAQTAAPTATAGADTVTQGSGFQAAQMAAVTRDMADGAAAGPDFIPAMRQPFTPTPQVPPTVPTAAVPVPPPSSEHILGQMRANVAQDGTIKVALRPEGLGRLEVELARGDDGQMRVTVRAEQGTVLTALRADREGLVALLRDAGHRVEDSALNFSDFGSGQQGAQPDQHSDQRQHEGQTLFPGQVAPQVAPAPDAPAQFNRVSAPADGIDINV